MTRAGSIAAVMMSGCVLAGVLGAPGVARADAHADALAAAGEKIGAFWDRTNDNDWADFILEDASWKPTVCTAAIATAKSAGVKPGDIMIGKFMNHPKAKPTSSSTPYALQLPFSEAEGVCTKFAETQKAQGLAKVVRAAVQRKQDQPAPTAENAAIYNETAADDTIKFGRDCIKTLDAAMKNGVAESTEVNVRGTKVSIGEGKRICEALVTEGEQFAVLLKEAAKAKRAAKGKKYEAVGIAGEKLELMIEYDDVYWRGKGCEKIDDPAVLAKSSVLFQWLENADGTHTIRRYQFNKNKVAKKSEKTYRTQAQAYKGCK